MGISIGGSAIEGLSYGGAKLSGASYGGSTVWTAATPYTGFLDVGGIPTPSMAVSNQVATTAYTGACEIIRVGSSPSTIGFDDNKFNATQWNTATGNGANPAYGTTWYSQVGSDDLTQAVESSQPIVDIAGANHSDSARYYKGSMYQPSTKMSAFTVCNFDNFLSSQTLLSQDDIGGNRQWIFFYHKDTDQMRMLAFGSNGTLSAYIARASTVLGTGTIGLGFSYDSVTGVKIYKDGVSQTVVNAVAGTIDAKNAPLSVGAFSNGTSAITGLVSTACFWNNSTLSDANYLDMYNQHEVNK